MPLVTAQIFRDTYRVPVAVLNHSFAPAISAASTHVKRAVGSAAYADAELADPQDDARRDMLKLAELYLALYYAIPLLNPRLTAAGLLIEMVSDDNARERILDPEEMASLRETLLETAESMISPYAAAPGGTGGAQRRGGAVGVIDPLNIAARGDAALKEILPWSNSRLPLI